MQNVLIKMLGRCLKSIWLVTGLSLAAMAVPAVAQQTVFTYDASGNTIAMTNSGSASPTIATQPQTQLLASNTAVSFSVEATGAGVSYQWLSNGVPIIGEQVSVLTIDTFMCKMSKVRTDTGTDPNYKMGEPIKLIACNAGTGRNQIAQQLANNLGTIVYAGANFVSINSDGSVYVGPQANPQVNTTGTIDLDKYPSEGYTTFYPQPTR